jgi:hypothetical protein
MNKYIHILICTSLLLVFQAAMAAGATMELKPAGIEITTFYNGTTVTIEGQIPADAEAVIRVSGEGEELHLKKKGTVGGLLWMNTGDVSLENAPKTYMTYTSASLGDINASAAQTYGLKALKDRITVLPESEDKEFIIGEFVKLKKKDGLYNVNPNTVSYGTVAQGMKSFTVTAVIPPRMGKGDYSVDMGVVQGNKIVDQLSQSLQVIQVGFPAKLTKLAFQNPLLHGIMAVIIAIAAGLFMGVVFKSKGGAH